MMNPEQISLIVSTYNHPSYLDLCLRSVFEQSDTPSQIVIADDGSATETTQVIEHFRRRSPVPLLHVWHADDGFRKGIILNKAMAQATGEYLVVLDGDIIVHPKFIEDHLSVVQEGHFVSGSRMMLSARQVEEIKKQPHPHISLLARLCTPNAYRSQLLMKVVSPRYKRNDKHRTLKGGNMGVWKSDIVRVNGYDEDFHGWGYEDTDLGERLRNCGLTMMNLKWGGVAYHLWHPENCRSGENDNLTRLLQTRATQRIRCLNGIDKYLPDLLQLNPGFLKGHDECSGA